MSSNPAPSIEIVANAERRAYTVNDFSRAFSIGRTKIYALMKSGELKTVLVGGRRLIPADAAEALLKGAA